MRNSNDCLNVNLSTTAGRVLKDTLEFGTPCTNKVKDKDHRNSGNSKTENATSMKTNCLFLTNKSDKLN